MLSLGSIINSLDSGKTILRITDHIAELEIEHYGISPTLF